MRAREKFWTIAAHRCRPSPGRATMPPGSRRLLTLPRIDADRDRRSWANLAAIGCDGLSIVRPLPGRATMPPTYYRRKRAARAVFPFGFVCLKKVPTKSTYRRQAATIPDADRDRRSAITPTIDAACRPGCDGWSIVRPFPGRIAPGSRRSPMPLARMRIDADHRATCRRPSPPGRDDSRC